MTLKEKQSIEKFRNEDKAFIKEIYLSAKPKFMGFMIREYQLDNDICLDVYQDSFCLLHKKIMNGSITEMTSSFETLLIGFGRNLVRNAQRKKSELYSIDLPETADVETPFTLLAAKTQKFAVRNILNLVGHDCQKVLKSFYYLEKSMAEIADELSYANANVAKKKKYECLKKLRSKVNQSTWN